MIIQLSPPFLFANQTPYGEVGYTIIDDVLSLPERMPAIYRRLTT